jgi:hypothetical protein
MEIKNLISREEGVWFVLNKLELNEEQRTLLTNKDGDSEERKQLLEEIKTNRESPAQQEDVDLAQSIYLQYKPELKEGDDYRLLSVNATFKDDVLVNGIINCRVNGSHKQIRFKNK